jgi:hypothetical protein
MNQSTKETLQVYSKILLTCFISGMVFLLFWFILHLLIGNIGYIVHSKIFNISEFDYTLMNYYGMAAVKIFSFVFFLIPFVAIKIILKRQK